MIWVGIAHPGYFLFQDSLGAVGITHSGFCAKKYRVTA